MKIECLRCKIKLIKKPLTDSYFKSNGFYISELCNSSGFKVNVYECPKCGKIELFIPSTIEEKRKDEIEYQKDKIKECKKKLINLNKLDEALR